MLITEIEPQIKDMGKDAYTKELAPAIENSRRIGTVLDLYLKVKNYLLNGSVQEMQEAMKDTGLYFGFQNENFLYSEDPNYSPTIKIHSEQEKTTYYLEPTMIVRGEVMYGSENDIDQGWFIKPAESEFAGVIEQGRRIKSMNASAEVNDTLEKLDESTQSHYDNLREVALELLIAENAKGKEIVQSEEELVKEAA